MEGIRKSFAPLTVDGQTHHFTHLAPTAVPLAGHGPDKTDLHVRISFKSHVYSQSCAHDEMDFHFRDEKKIKRRFCPDRYKISLGLPKMCRDLLTQNANTWVSKDKNQVSNLAVIDSQLVTGHHDTVIYYLFPSSVEGLDVEMVVKSVYNKYIDFGHIKRRYKMIQMVKTSYYQSKQVP